MKGFTRVKMTAQQQVPIEMQRLLGRAGVEFGQVVPGVVQQGETPVGAFAVRVQDGLVDLVAPEQLAPAVGVAAGHPGGIQPGNVQALAVDLDAALPPGQWLRGAERVFAKVQIGCVSLENEVALVVVFQCRRLPKPADSWRIARVIANGGGEDRSVAGGRRGLGSTG